MRQRGETDALFGRWFLLRYRALRSQQALEPRIVAQFAGLALGVLLVLPAPASALCGVWQGTFTVSTSASATGVTSTGLGTSGSQTVSAGIASASSVGTSVTISTGTDQFGRRLPAGTYNVRFYNSTATLPGYLDHFGWAMCAATGEPGVTRAVVSVGADGKIVGQPKTIALPSPLRAETGSQESAIAISNSNVTYGNQVPVQIVDAPPGQPTSVVAKSFNEKVDVTWGVAVAGSPASSYTVTVYRSSDRSVVARKTQSASLSRRQTFTFRDGIANGRDYDVGVVAANALGDGSSASSPTVTPQAAPWSMSDTMGGANPSMPVVTCHTSWGVDCDTGNFSYSRTDLAVAGRGIPSEFTLTYNSQDPLRWTNNYAMRVTSSDAQTRVVHQENGSTVYFFADGAGGWHAEGGAQATLATNADGTYTFKRSRALTTFGFSAAGKLLSQSDRNGYRTVLGYDASGRLLRVTDPAGRALSFSYNAANQLSQVADPAGRQVLLSYGSLGLPVRVTDPAGGVTTFAYSNDTLGHLTTITSPNANALPSGNVLNNAYDGGVLSSQTGDAPGRTMTYQYASPDAPEPSPGTPTTSTSTITDPNGHVVIARHSNFRLTSITRAAGSPQEATSSFVRDPITMRATATTDPRGKLWRNSYDDRGNLLTSTDPLARTTSYAYDAQNQLRSESDALGVTTSYAYDANSNLTSVSTPLMGSAQTQRTSYAYDPVKPGDLTRVTDANGGAWSYAYDASGNQIGATDPVGDRQAFAYDAVGRLAASTSPRGTVTGATPADYTTSYGYDPLDDLISIRDPLGQFTRFEYDPNQNLTAQVDPNGRRTSYAYDIYDELTTVTRPDGSTMKTAYDKAGNVSAQTDPAGQSTTYTYDALNRVASETDPLARTRSYRYDPAGNPTSFVDAAAKTTSYGYDDANQLNAITYSDRATAPVSYGYDAVGRRSSMRDGGGQSTNSYDSLDRLTGHTDAGGRTVGYRYDLNDQLTAIVYPSALGGGGGTVMRSYDDAGRLASVSDWLGHTTSFGYDADSQLTSASYPNAATATQRYDRAGQLTSIAASSPAGGQILNLSYGHDLAGLLTSEGSKTFGYDVNDRLKTQSAAPAVSYAYDAADNMTSATVTAGNAQTQSYDAAHQLTTTKTTTGSQTTTVSYSYDANGNRTSDGTGGTYVYDQPDRLTAYKNNTYTYDGNGLRTKKNGSSGSRTFTWDIADELPLIIGDTSTAYVTGPDGLPLEQITSSGTARYYHQDQLGSTRALTDQTGATIATYAYDPYGNPTANTGTITNPFGYAGQYTDDETGLQYLRARYYDPHTQNFLTRDPLAYLTRSPYNYADNNPTNNTDPTGLGCQDSGQGGGSGPSEVEPPEEEPTAPRVPRVPRVPRPPRKRGGSGAAKGGEALGRRGAFGEAKRRIGVPRTEQPTSVGPAYNKAGDVIPGSRVYRFGEGPDAPYITNHPPTRYPDGGYQPGHFHPNAPGGDPHIYYGH